MWNNKIGTVKINFCSWHKVLVELIYNMLFPKLKTHSAPISWNIYVLVTLMLTLTRYEGKQTHDKSKSQIEEWVIKKMFFKTLSNKRVFSRKTLLQTAFVRCFSKYIFILLFFIRTHRKIVMIPKVKKKTLYFHWGK